MQSQEDGVSGAEPPVLLDIESDNIIHAGLASSLTEHPQHHVRHCWGGGQQYNVMSQYQP